MQEVRVEATCPKCDEHLAIGVEYPSDPLELSPDVRGGKDPDGCIWKYRITSDELKHFITEKAKSYVPDVEVECIPRYCEKKKRKDYDPHRSYASLRIAFTDHILEKGADMGWFGELGRDDNDCRIINSLLNGIIRKYGFDRKKVDSWLKSYKVMEDLEDAFGMTEVYIRDLASYTTPKRVVANDNSKTHIIIFSAAAENIIADYLTEVNSGKLPGKMSIVDVYPISQGVVEWVVHVDPSQHITKENPYVRQLLMGETKAKK